DSPLAGGAHGCHRHNVHGGAGKTRPRYGSVGEAAYDRLKAVVAVMVDVVGLRGGDQHAVDTAGDEAAQEMTPARPETAEDLRQCPLQVGNGGGAGVECLHGVDKHDLAVETGDVLAEEGLYHMRLVRLKASFHHRMERARLCAFAFQAR